MEYPRIPTHAETASIERALIEITHVLFTNVLCTNEGKQNVLIATDSERSGFAFIKQTPEYLLLKFTAKVTSIRDHRYSTKEFAIKNVSFCAVLI